MLIFAIGVGRQVVGSDNSASLRLSNVEPNETVGKGALWPGIDTFIETRRIALIGRSTISKGTAS
jgi:hypothetical protein